MMRKFFNSMFFKMLLLIMVVSIPILICGMAINVVMYDRIVDKNVTHFRSVSKTGAENLFSQMSNLISLSGDLVNLPSVKALSGEEGSSADISESILTTQRFAYSLLNSTLLANDIEIYFPTRNFIISGLTDGTRNFDEFKYAEMRRMLAESNSNRLRNLDGKLCFFFKLSPFTVPGRRTGVVCVTFSRSALSGILRERGESSGNLDVLEADGLMFSEDGKRDESNELINRISGLAFQDNMAKEGGALLFRFESERLGLVWLTNLGAENYRMDMTFYWLLSCGFLLISVGLIIFSARRIRNLLILPVNKLVSGLERIQNREFDVKLDVQSGIAEIQALYGYFNQTAERLQSLVSEVREDAVRLQMAELKQLQYQINPHFLYNTLHMINCMADAEEYGSIVCLTGHLNRFYQYLTKVKGDSTLGEELLHAESYVRVQQIRFGERIRFEIGEIGELYSLKIPSLILQPLVENVYTHGLASKEENGFFRILFEHTEGLCRISVEDNGESLTDSELVRLSAEIDHSPDFVTDNVALVNISRRLKLKFGEKGRLILERSELGGLRVVVCISDEGGKT